MIVVLSLLSLVAVMGEQPPAGRNANPPRVEENSAGQAAKQAGPDKQAASKQQDESPVAATVDGFAIRVQDVRRELVISTRGREVAPAARPALEASALEKLVNRELALKFLKTTEHFASETEITQHWDRLKSRLESRSIAPEKHLQEKGFRDLQHWRHEAGWELSWTAFAKHYTKDEYLEKYFKRNQRHFDGSEVRVAHILWKTPNARSLLQARKEASRVRAAIVAKEISFEAAAKKHSQSPTAEQGGDIGFLDRRRTMPESFSKAAFDLQVGQLSQPVSTQFGVHLIRCLEIKPGKTSWQAARKETSAAVRRWLFTWAADKVRDATQVKYSGAIPYWRDDDGGRRLVDALGQ